MSLKLVLFDFDGVIADSVHVKTKAFQELFHDYPEHLDAITNYHVTNGGISRYVKIQHIYKNMLKKDLADDELEMYCQRFSELAKQKVIDSPFIDGAPEVLEYCLGKFPMYIISGTPQDEMREVVTQRSLDNYFVNVYGSPRKKGEIINLILADTGFKPEEAIFVGDSINDLDGAKQAGVPFVSISQDSNASWVKDKSVILRVRNLHELVSYIQSQEETELIGK